MMFKSTAIKFVSFGEVLFDVFKKEKKVGGAPLNVASRIRSFGFPVAVVSAVGNDEDGNLLLAYMKERGLDFSSVQVKPEYETGKVNVSLDKQGMATYDIKFPVAWDNITYTREIAKVCEDAGVFIFGSLAARNETSRNTLLEILDSTNTFKVFDLNLRQPHYKKDVLQKLLKRADFLKFNDEEILEIAEMFGGNCTTLEEGIEFFKANFNAEKVCVTRGSEGAILFLNDNYYYNSGYSISLKDTVGAGDSFLGTLLASLLTNNGAQETLDLACAMGALVASYDGANPEVDQEELIRLTSSMKN